MENLLKALGSNKAGTLQLKNGEIINYGSIKVENEKFFFYTGKGLREMWHSSADPELSKELKTHSEEELMASDHIAALPVSEISQILN